MSPLPLVDALLWIAALALYGVGDTYTTAVGSRRPGFEEWSPLVRALLGPDPSPVGFAAFKAVTMVAFVGAYLAVDAPTYRTLVPLALAVVGLAATASNCWLLWRTPGASG